MNDVDLPASWATAQIGDVTEVNPPGSTTVAAEDALVSFVPMAAVSELSGHIDLSTKKQFAQVKKGFTRFKNGDVLFAKITPSMENGKIAVARELEGGIGCGTTEFHVIRPESGVEADYLRFYFVRSAFRQEARKNMQGAVGQQRVPADFIREAQIPLAPTGEQARIVSRIEELFSRIDEGERALQRVQKLVERYRQSVLKAAITGELTREWREKHKGRLESGEALLQRILKARREAWEKAELAKMEAKGVQPANDKWKDQYEEPSSPDTTYQIHLPNTWLWSSLGQLFQVSVGSTPSRKSGEYWNGTIPWVSSGEVAFCRINKTEEAITELGYENSSVRLHPKGTVLLAMIGEGKTRGQAAILDIDACHNQNAAAIGVPATPIPPEYVYRFLEYHYESVRGISQGGNQPALNSELVRRISIPLPPLAEIAEICSLVERQLGAIAHIADDLEKQRQRIKAQRQSVLREAFKGALVPQDAKEEPASLLVERITAARRLGDATLTGRRKRKVAT